TERVRWLIPGMVARKRKPAKKALAENLLRLRGEQGLSQRGLAAAASVRQSLVSAIELETANPTLSSIESIADALGVVAGELLLPFSD
ncbi:MAG: Transcriptional regulator, partial [Tardiphaga sp.]|uniref:helix-turn-helix domain-containing protein n=1 Tax=Tardiphaga sp. TaxID=1926292 RepID=UPI0026380EAC